MFHIPARVDVPRSPPIVCCLHPHTPQSLTFFCLNNSTKAAHGLERSGAHIFHLLGMCWDIFLGGIHPINNKSHSPNKQSTDQIHNIILRRVRGHHQHETLCHPVPSHSILSRFALSYPILFVSVCSTGLSVLSPSQTLIHSTPQSNINK